MALDYLILQERNLLEILQQQTCAVRIDAPKLVWYKKYNGLPQIALIVGQRSKPRL